MLIAEIFYSLQGEGLLAGVPSVFIRTSGCNLRCAWCDTPYASWRPEGATRTVAEVVAETATHRAARHTVLTGGEPMLAPEAPELAAEIKALGHHLTIETAATIAPGRIACDLASLSPKLLNSAPDATRHPAWRKRHEATRWKPDAVRAWMDHCAWQLKFVVSRPEDLDELETMLEKLGREIPRDRVLLMAEGVRAEQVRERGAWIGELCKARGYRYSPRLQLDLYGNRRGT